MFFPNSPLGGPFLLSLKYIESLEDVSMFHTVHVLLPSQKWLRFHDLGCVESAEVLSKTEGAVLLGKDQDLASPL